MRHKEHIGRVRFIGLTTAYGIRGTATLRLQRWHYDTLSSPQLQQDPFTISDDFGPDGVVGAWALSQLQQGSKGRSGTLPAEPDNSDVRPAR